MKFDKKRFEELHQVQSEDPPCVTIYIPTYRVGHEKEDEIRFKNALTEVSEKLQTDGLYAKEGMQSREVERFLKPASDLLDNQEFWQHQSDGLAVFIGKDRFEHYPVPINLYPLTYVNSHFYLHPLLPLLTGKDRYFLLALSQGEVRFFECHSHHITPVKISDLVPENFDAAMASEDPEKTLQMRSVTQGQASVFHGHGLHKDQEDWQIEQYCRMVDDGLMKMLHDETAPLVVAAVDELASLYQKVSDYSNVMDFKVTGNPEDDAPGMLHEKSWALMEQHFGKELTKQNELFAESMVIGQAAMTPQDVIPAAINGRVNTLLVADGAPVRWGSFDVSTNRINVFPKQVPGAACLNNLAACKTFTQSGKVYHVSPEEFPNLQSELGAILRY